MLVSELFQQEFKIKEFPVKCAYFYVYCCDMQDFFTLKDQSVNNNIAFPLHTTESIELFPGFGILMQ